MNNSCNANFCYRDIRDIGRAPDGYAGRDGANGKIFHRYYPGRAGECGRDGKDARHLVVRHRQDDGLPGVAGRDGRSPCDDTNSNWHKYKNIHFKAGFAEGYRSCRNGH